VLSISDKQLKDSTKVATYLLHRAESFLRS